jgi:hypothetical protein
MSALLSGYITKEKLQEILKVVESKSAKGFEFTASINDETNDYGQNVSLFASQSKEDREAKKSKYYFGSGKVFWTDGKITLAAKKDAAPAATNTPAAAPQDLPF